MITLFPDQEEWIGGLRGSFKRGHEAPLGVASTGFGKTVCFSWLTDKLVQNTKRVALLVHRDELVDQISETLSEFGVRHGLVVANGLYDRRLLAHVMSVMTLARRLERIAVPDYVIVDEAHHGTAATWRKIISYWKARNPNLRVIGVTATPKLLSGKGLGVNCGGLFDDMILAPPMRALIDAGRLSDYRMFAPASAIDLSGVHVVGGDYNKKELRSAMDKPAIVGDSIKEYRRLCDYAPAVGFTVSVEKAHETAERFKAAGYNAVALDGTTDRALRKQIIRDFSRSDGTIHQLFSCSLVDEGFDVPGIVCGIDLAPTLSLARYLQRLGRTLRTAPGKDVAYLLDQAGNSLRHGLPDDEREWSLDGDTAGNKKKDEETVACRQCKKCYAVSPAWATKCKDCGTAFPLKPRQIEEVAGTLSEVEIARARKQAVIDQAAAKTLEDLIRLGTARGMKNPAGWARHVHEARVAKGRA